MPARKRSKISRQRGSTTHGWGARKKHRGSGNRGGQGMAGTGKRAQSKKTQIWGTDYPGKYGFKRKGQVLKINAINIDDLDAQMDKFITSKKAIREGDHYVVDLSNLGYNKLLGNGSLKNKFKITVDFASQNAIAKVKEAGGEVVLKSQ